MFYINISTAILISSNIKFKKPFIQDAIFLLVVTRYSINFREYKILKIWVLKAQFCPQNSIGNFLKTLPIFSSVFQKLKRKIWPQTQGAE